MPTILEAADLLPAGNHGAAAGRGFVGDGRFRRAGVLGAEGDRFVDSIGSPGNHDPDGLGRLTFLNLVTRGGKAR